jgi:arylsulfatase A-like enzyme
LGPRGDVILQLDANVGEVLAELDRLQLAEKTLVIFTSDNGAVVDDGYRDDAVTRLGDHRPNGPWRGGKYSKYEGGTRVPFLVRWPGHITPGVSSALFSQVDLLATLAALIGQSPDSRQSPDSENHLATLLGKQTTGRREVVEQGQGLALRQEQWKFIPPSDGAPIAWETGLETGNQPQPQLYNLSTDPVETNNLALQETDRVRQLQQRLGELRAQALRP